MTGDISLYFHIPFCSRKCPYCHFYVIPDKLEFKNQLAEGLKLEWKKLQPLLEQKQLVSIYFGGGTPSLFGPNAIGNILKEINFPKNCEITLEANPEEVSLSLIQAYKETGINRISLGVQSLDDSSLEVLGRQHSAQKALKAIDDIYGAGIRNISIDLMYDLPGQTLDSWQRTLSHIEKLPITHLSLYNLTIEPHTGFFKRKKALTPLLPTPETSLQMLHTAVSHLEKAGLSRYEISAFAKPGFSSLHNTGYWTGRPFLGLGPSAFSYWNKKRFRNVASLSRYTAALKEDRSAVDFEEELPYPANVAELLAIRLRLLEGVNISEWNLPQPLTDVLSDLHKKGWIAYDGTHTKLTEDGLLWYDSVAEAIIL